MSSISENVNQVNQINQVPLDGAPDAVPNPERFRYDDIKKELTKTNEFTISDLDNFGSKSNHEKLLADLEKNVVDAKNHGYTWVETVYDEITRAIAYGRAHLPTTGMDPGRAGTFKEITEHLHNTSNPMTCTTANQGIKVCIHIAESYNKSAKLMAAIYDMKTASFKVELLNLAANMGLKAEYLQGLLKKYCQEASGNAPRQVALASFLTGMRKTKMDAAKMKALSTSDIAHPSKLIGCLLPLFKEVAVVLSEYTFIMIVWRHGPVGPVSRGDQGHQTHQARLYGRVL